MLRQEKSYPGNYGTILHVVGELSDVKLHLDPTRICSHCPRVSGALSTLNPKQQSPGPCSLAGKSVSSAAPPDHLNSFALGSDHAPDFCFLAFALALRNGTSTWLPTTESLRLSTRCSLRCASGFSIRVSEEATQLLKFTITLISPGTGFCV